MNVGRDSRISRPPSSLIGIQNSLPKYLDKIGRAEGIMESMRQAISFNKDFEPLSAFQRIDRNDDMCITAHEIMRFLRENSVHSVTEEDAQNMISYYFEGPYEQAHINFPSFLEVCLTSEDDVLRFSVGQRPRNYEPTRGGYLDPVVEQQLAGLLEREIIFKKEWSQLGLRDLVSHIRREKVKIRRENISAYYQKPIQMVTSMPPTITSPPVEVKEIYTGPVTISSGLEPVDSNTKPPVSPIGEGLRDPFEGSTTNLRIKTGQKLSQGKKRRQQPPVFERPLPERHRAEAVRPSSKPKEKAWKPGGGRNVLQRDIREVDKELQKKANQA